MPAFQYFGSGLRPISTERSQWSNVNGPLDTVDELMLIKGWNEPVSAVSSATVYEAVAPFLTTYSVDQKINVNGVDAETLMAFLDVDESLAEEIIRERLGPDGLPGTEDDKPFKDVGDLAGRVPGLNAAIAERVTFSAQGRFFIQSQGRVGDITRTVNCVVSFSDKSWVILNWVEGELPSGVSLMH